MELSKRTGVPKYFTNSVWESIHIVPKPWEKHILFPFLKCAIHKGCIHSARWGNVRCLLATIPVSGSGDKLSLASVHCAVLKQAGETALVSSFCSDGELRLRRLRRCALSFGLTSIRKNTKGGGFFDAVEFFSLSLSHVDALVCGVSYTGPERPGSYRVNEYR